MFASVSALNYYASITNRKFIPLLALCFILKPSIKNLFTRDNLFFLFLLFAVQQLIKYFTATMRNLKRQGNFILQHVKVTSWIWKKFFAQLDSSIVLNIDFYLISCELLSPIKNYNEIYFLFTLEASTFAIKFFINENIKDW